MKCISHIMYQLQLATMIKQKMYKIVFEVYSKWVMFYCFLSINVGWLVIVVSFFSLFSVDIMSGIAISSDDTHDRWKCGDGKDDTNNHYTTTIAWHHESLITTSVAIMTQIYFLLLAMLYHWFKYNIQYNL